MKGSLTATSSTSSLWSATLATSLPILPNPIKTLKMGSAKAHNPITYRSMWWGREARWVPVSVGQRVTPTVKAESRSPSPSRTFPPSTLTSVLPFGLTCHLAVLGWTRGRPHHHPPGGHQRWK
ncbi:hypothetical protein BHM03_00040184 [Ensete ventricosum]|nr:hypothetical protein BHM03_00040184 [Ensete ventricosum]